MNLTSSYRKALSVLLPAVGAALLVGQCTANDPGEIGIFFAVYGALLSGALVLLAGALVIVAGSGPALLAWVVVSGGAYLGMLLAVNAAYGGAGGFFFVQGLAIAAVGLIIGMALGRESGFMRGAALVIVSAVATLCGLASLFGAYLTSADICIGYFGVDCGHTSPIRWLRFSALAGLGPSGIAVAPAALAWILHRRSAGCKTNLSRGD